MQRMVIAILLTVLLPAAPGYSQEEQTPIWPELEPGPHQVGYTVLHLYDFSRTYKPDVDYFGTKTEGELARPVQISIWYPASPAPDARRLTYGDYRRVSISETDFSRAESIWTDAGLNFAKMSVLRRGGKPDKIMEVFDRVSWAVLDAEQIPGPFPLILYGPGGDCPPWDNAVLCEYLASHGFIVAASPTHYAYFQQQEYNTQRAEARVRDFEFVLAFMRGFPEVDIDRVGAMGWSWGGLNSVLFAIRNHLVDAVVTLDGSMAYPTYATAAKDHFDYNLKRLTKPILCFVQKPQPFQELAFFDNFLYADAKLLQFNDLTHENFSSGILIETFDIIGFDDGRDTARMRTGYTLVCRYAERFFSAVLEGDEQAAAFVANQPEANGAPEGGIAFLSEKKAHKAPPTRFDLYRLYMQQGIDAALAEIARVHEIDPEHHFFDETDTTSMGMRMVRNGRSKEGIDALRLVAAAFPNSWKAQFALGDVYLFAGDNANAAECYRKARELNPESKCAQAFADWGGAAYENDDPTYLERFTGEYELGGEIVLVEIRDGSLTAVLKNQPPYAQVPVAENIFRYADSPGFSAIYIEDESGQISGMLLHQPQGDFELKRLH